MNRLELLPDDIIADIYEVNRQQDLQKIQDLEKQIEKLTEKNEEMKATLINEEYDFCCICEDFEYKESYAINKCSNCSSCVCLDCEYRYLGEDTFCDSNCCKSFMKKLAIKTIKCNPIFRRYLFKIKERIKELLPVVFMDGARCKCCDKRVWIGDEQERINLYLVEDGRAELGSCGKAICDDCDDCAE